MEGPMNIFLKSLNLAHLEELFTTEKISLEILREFKHEDLKSIGVTAYGERHVILKRVKDFYKSVSGTGTERDVDPTENSFLYQKTDLNLCNYEVFIVDGSLTLREKSCCLNKASCSNTDPAIEAGEPLSSGLSSGAAFCSLSDDGSVDLFSAINQDRSLTLREKSCCLSKANCFNTDPVIEASELLSSGAASCSLSDDGSVDFFSAINQDGSLTLREESCCLSKPSCSNTDPVIEASEPLSSGAASCSLSDDGSEDLFSAINQDGDLTLREKSCCLSKVSCSNIEPAIRTGECLSSGAATCSLALSDDTINGSVDLFSDDGYQVIVEENKPVDNQIKGKKKKCPECNKLYSNLSRHLKLHGLENKGRLALLYSLRKRNPKGKVRLCPFPQCNGIPGFSRLDSHLLGVHELTRGDPLYRKFIKSYKIPEKSELRQQQKQKTESCKFAQDQSNEFKKFLISLDGGELEQYNGVQQWYKLRQILNGAGITNTEGIASSTNKKLFETYFVNYANTHEPSSAVTCASTLIMYLKYLRDTLNHQDYQEITKFINNIKGWQSSFRKRAKPRENASQEISVEDTQKFFNSTFYKNVCDQISTIKQQEIKDIKMSKEIHARIRNVLIILALFRNSSRVGALANMTLKEFKDAKHDDKADKFVILVANHKTKASAGCNRIVLPSSFYYKYVTYRDKVRPFACFSGRKVLETDTMFLTWSGNFIISTDIDHGIQSSWNLAGIEGKLTGNMFRKTTTTRVHSQMPNIKEATARHLCHNLSTAERFYKISTRTDESIRTSDQIFSLFVGDLELEEDAESGNCSAVIHEATRPTSQSDFEVFELEGQSEVITSQGDDSILSKDDILKIKPKGRCYFDSCERSFIANTFADTIKACIVPTLQELRICVENDEKLARLMENKNADVLKVKGAIQNLVNKRKNLK